MSQLQKPVPFPQTDDKTTPPKLPPSTFSPSTLPVHVSEPEVPQSPLLDQSRDTNRSSLIVALAVILSVVIIDTNASYHYNSSASGVARSWWRAFVINVVVVLHLCHVCCTYGLNNARFNRSLCFFIVSLLAFPVVLAILATIHKATGKTVWFELVNGCLGLSLNLCEHVMGFTNKDGTNGSERARCCTLNVESKFLLLLIELAIVGAHVYVRHSRKDRT